MTPEHLPNTPRKPPASVPRPETHWYTLALRLEYAFLATGAQLVRLLAPTGNRPGCVPGLCLRAAERCGEIKKEFEVVMVELRSSISPPSQPAEYQLCQN